MTNTPPPLSPEIQAQLDALVGYGWHEGDADSREARAKAVAEAAYRLGASEVQREFEIASGYYAKWQKAEAQFAEAAARLREMEQALAIVRYEEDRNA